MMHSKCASLPRSKACILLHSSFRAVGRKRLRQRKATTLHKSRSKAFVANSFGKAVQPLFGSRWKMTQALGGLSLWNRRKPAPESRSDLQSQKFTKVAPMPAGIFVFF